MKYVKIIRTESEWITVGRFIQETQPQTYRQLKTLFPPLSRLVTDEREFNDIKRLMEERKGVNL